MRKNIFYFIGTVCLLTVFLMLSPAGNTGVQASTSDSFSLTDHSGYCGKNTMWNFDEDTGTLTIAGSGEMSDYAPWDDYADEITKVVIESGVTSIGSYDFNGYTSLKSVKIASSVETIGEAAFRFCTGLKSVTIASGVTQIGDYAFYGCSSLKTLTIKGTGLTTIGESAFESCEALTGVTFPSSLKKIGASAFADTALTSVTIPKNVTSIGSSAFSGCASLTAVKVSESNTKYSAKSGVLYNKNKTKLILYPAAKTSESFTIPSTVTTVSANAFKKNTNLQKVYIGTGVETLGKYAFRGCSGLTTVVFRGAAPEFSNAYVFRGVTATVKYPVSESGSWTSSVRTDYGGSLTWQSYALQIKYADITLSKTSYTYNSEKTRKPSVTVTVNGKTLTKGTDYTVTYADGRKNIGSYTVTVTGIGNYSGSDETSFTIKPAKVTLSGVKSSSKKKITVSWKNAGGEVKYQIAYRKKGASSWKKVTCSADTYKKTISSLTSGKTYYVKVRAYKKVSGKTYYGSWSAASSVSVK